MKTIEINVLTFSELSEDAKEAAYHNWLSKGHETPWTTENENVLKEFERRFPIEVKNWSYGGGDAGISFKFTGTEDQEKLSGIRLMAHLYWNYFNDIFQGKYYGRLSKKFKDGKLIPISKEHPAGFRHIKRHSKVMFDDSCVLTGYCIDDDTMKPIYDFLIKPSVNVTFYDLMENCLNSWVTACNNDAEYSSSMEAFIDMAGANDYEFTEDGEIY